MYGPALFVKFCAVAGALPVGEYRTFPPMKPTAYLLQATLIVLWWIGLSLSADFFAAFQWRGIGEVAFRSFLLPDLVVIALLSVVLGYREVPLLDYVILGGFAFASLYCVNATVLTGSGYLPTTAMLLGLCYNFFLVAGELTFRQSTSTGVGINALKTLVQIVCVWTVTLVALPYLIMTAFGEPPTPVGPPLSWLGWALIATSSLLGLGSAYVMVTRGAGTPLPLDQTNRLVVSGPYRFVRNPMAVAGIGQGIGLSLLFASWPLLAYALLGAVAWQVVVKPLEEKNMLERFGPAYARYRTEVRCWLPRYANK